MSHRYELTWGGRPLIIEADFVLREEPMPLAGHLLIIIPKQAYLHRTFRCMTEQRRPTGGMVSLRLFPAERSPHSSHFNNNFMLPDAKNFGNKCLGLGRILGG